jgi:hypothetical protein
MAQCNRKKCLRLSIAICDKANLCDRCSTASFTLNDAAASGIWLARSDKMMSLDGKRLMGYETHNFGFGRG